MRKSPRIPAKTFDEKFEAGEDLTEHLELSRAVRRVNVDFPAGTVAALDREAARLGISRQALIKVWITVSPWEGQSPRL